MQKKHKSKTDFKSDVLAAVHASAVALQKVGAIDQTTMGQFDETCATSKQVKNDHVQVESRRFVHVDAEKDA